MQPKSPLTLKLSAPCYISTGNVGKLREIIPMVQSYFPWMTPIQGQSTSALEDAPDFVGNALIKARALAKELIDSNAAKSFYVLADDSGLCVDALDGAPGVHSARYAGDHVNSAAHIKKLLGALSAYPLPEQRKAHYHCALACIFVIDSQEFFAMGQGSCHGHIGFECVGQSGFGYDPVFIDALTQKSYAELNYEEKNASSHRQNAFKDLAKNISAHNK